jgi:Ca2+-binding RTX toxin-like protein
MAVITGSTTIDWSTVSLSQADFASHFVTFLNRVDQIFTELKDPALYSIVSVSSTVVVLDLFSGGRLRLGLSRLTPPLTTSFSFHNANTGEILRYGSRVLSNGNEFVTSATIGSAGFSETIKGSIFIPDEFPDAGSVSGSVTSLVVKIGSATVTLSGVLNVTSDLTSASLTGMVTGILVTSGTNTVKMTGLSMDIDVIEAALAADTLSTVNDLFSLVGNQLTGNDTITYANNSAVGMSFFGGGGNDTIVINGRNGDTLNGGDGNDILKGGLGQDTVNGEAGNDLITMLVTPGNVDTIDAGGDTDTLVLSGVVPGDHIVVADLSQADQVVSIGGIPDALVQSGFENINAAGIGSSLTVTGSAGNNILIGSKGNDSIDGGAGTDTMAGGLGNDTYAVDVDTDLVTEALNGGVDLVQSTAVNFTLSANVERLTLLGTADSNGTGNALNNMLTGNSGVNILTGGAGNDTYVVQNETDSVVENVNGGTDVVRSAAANFTLGANVEHLILLDGTDINGTGNALNNVLTGNSGNNILSGGNGNDRLIGNAGNDILDGGIGIDTMAGGVGDDTYIRDVAADVITEALNAGTDTVQSALSYTLGANVENLTLTGSANLTGTGNQLINTLTGNDADNLLAGLAGNDMLLGGTGNDTLNGGLGNDQLDGGLGNDTLIGDLGQDTVTGGAGDDRITMLVTAGNVDTIDAGADTDTLVLSGVVPGHRIVVADLSQADQVASIGGIPDALVQSGFENINATGIGSSLIATGSDGDNIMIGSKGNDTIDGGDGNDTLNGGAGNDTLAGGAGDDLMILNAGADIVVENPGEGSDTVRLAYSVTVPTLIDLTSAYGGNVENVQVTGSGRFNLTGNVAANHLTGNASNNILIGGDGNDALNGGVGADNLQGGSGDDLILIGAVSEYATGEVIDGGADSDTLRYTGTTAATLTLRATMTNIEQVQIASAAGDAAGTVAINVNAAAVTTGLTISGNGGNNVLTGTGQADVISGGAGTDMLIGGNGDDIFDLAPADYTAGEVINGGVGTDSLRLTGAGQTFDLTAISNAAFVDIEIVDLSEGDNTLTLKSQDVLAMSAGATLRIDGNANDEVTTSEISWIQGDDVPIGPNTYAQYTNNGATLLVDTDVAFNVAIPLSSLNGSNGFRLAGAIISGDGADVNNDGFSDVVGGNYLAYLGGETSGFPSGRGYVLFGHSSPFPETVQATALNGVDGVLLNGSEGSYAGQSINSAGDVNGDGLGDIIIGAAGNGMIPGVAYVVFGKEETFVPSFVTLLNLNGSDGFRLSGSSGSALGTSVDGAGDFNGDGVEDLIVGDPYATPNGPSSGSAYVVFGKTTGFTADVSLSSLNGTNGVRLDGGEALLRAGWGVSNAGDVNGDGIDDVLVAPYYASPTAGAGYVVFGKASGFSSSVDLSTLDGSDGFRFTGLPPVGDSTPIVLDSVGDMNGDGYSDIVVGAQEVDSNEVVNKSVEIS